MKRFQYPNSPDRKKHACLPSLQSRELKRIGYLSNLLVHTQFVVHNIYCTCVKTSAL